MKRQYQGAVEAIREWLAREEREPGTALPSVKHLAARFGFTPVVIQRACLVLISEGVLIRQGYKLRTGAGTRRNPVIEGVVHIATFLKEFGRTASRILTQRGVSHRVIELTWGKSIEPAFKKISAEKSAGLILWAPTIGQKPELLQMLSCPIVICAGGLPEWKYSTIRVDFREGTEAALRHLYERGHRQIAHVSCGPDRVNREFAEAYRWNCLKLGLKSSARRIWQAETADYPVLREAMLDGRQTASRGDGDFWQRHGGHLRHEDFFRAQRDFSSGLRWNAGRSELPTAADDHRHPGPRGGGVMGMHRAYCPNSNPPIGASKTTSHQGPVRTRIDSARIDPGFEIA